MKLAKILIIAAAVAAMAPEAGAAWRKTVRLTPQQLMEQAVDAFYDYDPDMAKEKINELKKLKKGVDPDSLAALEQKVERMAEMIQRVEDIVIVDSLTLNADDFFRHYRLSATAGTLSSPSELNVAGAASRPTVVYMPENESYMIWGGDTCLMQSRRLTDGTWEESAPVGANLNFGGVANYPFILSDGVTLYYATEGDDSLGGLDIYMSRSDRERYAMPQNLGMPYNSPFNDYMLAIDEEAGIGWFATDRNQMDDLVTVYVFVPNQIRRNLDVDSPNLADRARISSVAATWPEGENVDAVLRRIESISHDARRQSDEADFTFALPDGRIYTRWEQFVSADARRSMEAYVDAMAELESNLAGLERLRGSYRQGDEAAKNAILQLEKKTKALRQTLVRISNRVVKAEMR